METVALISKITALISGQLKNYIKVELSVLANKKTVTVHEIYSSITVMKSGAQTTMKFSCTNHMKQIKVTQGTLENSQ